MARRPSRLQRIRARYAALAVLVFSLVVPAGPARPASAGDAVWLVTAKEAALPDSPLRGPRRPLSQGPEIRVDSPVHKRAYATAFPVDIRFAEGPNGLAVNMGSLRITYRRAWGIDITERFQPFAAGQRIQFPDARLPTGQHSLEIYIEDIEENPSTKVLTLQITAEREEKTP